MELYKHEKDKGPYIGAVSFMEKKEEKLKRLYDQCTDEANACNIPISEYIIEVVINFRAKSRFGCCKIITGTLGKRTYKIEIASFIMDCEEKLIKTVIHHELIHTCPNCMNHGKTWRNYAGILNQRYGYSITATSKYENFGLNDLHGKEKDKYVIRCRNCSMEIRRKRKSKAVENIVNYRCSKCGGPLEVEELHYIL